MIGCNHYFTMWDFVQAYGRTSVVSTQDFYAALTPFYHLIYPNWEESVGHQAAMLDSLIRDYWGKASNPF